MPKTGHFRGCALVEVFARRPALSDLQDVGGFTARLGRRRHEGPPDFANILSWHVKSLRALFSTHLPPVLVGFANQHVAFPLPNGDESVFGLVLVIILHLDVHLPRSDGQIATFFRHDSEFLCARFRRRTLIGSTSGMCPLPSAEQKENEILAKHGTNQHQSFQPEDTDMIKRNENTITHKQALKGDVLLYFLALRADAR